jgi:hypothetical protein
LLSYEVTKNKEEGKKKTNMLDIGGSACHKPSSSERSASYFPTQVQAGRQRNIKRGLLRQAVKKKRKKKSLGAWQGIILPF